ncbi:MAG: ATPase [Spirochaetaceae bacterium]|jgi:V/A-type H+-transporting ATPase subunit I|nr:ATPase [Spirochaetaceae bacterium]
MARTTRMRLIEMMVLKDDVSCVIEYLGKKGYFEFQEGPPPYDGAKPNEAKEMFDRLQVTRSYLALADNETFSEGVSMPGPGEYQEAERIIGLAEGIHRRETEMEDANKRVDEAYTEALAFANLKVPYEELEHLSFLTLRIGRIKPEVLDDLILALGDRAVIVPLGEDRSRILATASKKGRFALDAELHKFGFENVEISENFKGIPDEALEGLKTEREETAKKLAEIIEERANFAQTHEKSLRKLLSDFSLASQVQIVQNGLEATRLVYRITGWVPEADSQGMMKEIDDLTEGRVAIRLYDPKEVPSVNDGTEKVPVKLTHGKFVGSFERMIFSYGAPLYGTIDPTPFVAVFFTILFGIMFGDAGQGLIILLLGVLLTMNIIKWFPSWNKFGPIFIAVGCSSVVMGLLTGEFFGNSRVLDPVDNVLAEILRLKDHAPGTAVLHLLPERGHPLTKLFLFFLFTLGIGFIINSIGLVVNIINQFSLKRYGRALFGKTGLSGALFFWYVVFMAARIALLKTPVYGFDLFMLILTLLGIFMAEPLGRLVDRERPIFENGVGVGIIQGIVEILETLSSYLSNSVSFLRVGAFALAHAVLGFIIFTMTDLISQSAGPAGILVTIFGNAIVVVLEGMIVAIQVIRLQYYEFFSKFFSETGKEFTPFKFTYK